MHVKRFTKAQLKARVAPLPQNCRFCQTKLEDANRYVLRSRGGYVKYPRACKTCYFRELVRGPYRKETDHEEFGLTEAGRRLLAHSKARRRAIERKEVVLPHMRHRGLWVRLPYDKFGALFSFSVSQESDEIDETAIAQADEFVAAYWHHVGVELGDEDANLVYQWFRRAAENQFSFATISRRFFEKNLGRYQSQVVKLSLAGQQHAPDGIVTAAPKPDYRYKIMEHVFLRDHIDVRCYRGIENAYLESRVALGLAVHAKRAESIANWDLCDWVAMMRHVGASTGVYDIDADWASYCESYEPFWPTYEQALGCLREGEAA